MGWYCVINRILKKKKYMYMYIKFIVFENDNVYCGNFMGILIMDVNLVFLKIF